MRSGAVMSLMWLYGAAACCLTRTRDCMRGENYVLSVHFIVGLRPVCAQAHMLALAQLLDLISCTQGCCLLHPHTCDYMGQCMGMQGANLQEIRGGCSKFGSRAQFLTSWRP